MVITVSQESRLSVMCYDSILLLVWRTMLSTLSAEVRTAIVYTTKFVKEICLCYAASQVAVIMPVRHCEWEICKRITAYGAGVRCRIKATFRRCSVDEWLNDDGWMEQSLQTTKTRTGRVNKYRGPRAPDSHCYWTVGEWFPQPNPSPSPGPIRVGSVGVRPTIVRVDGAWNRATIRQDNGKSLRRTGRSRSRFPAGRSVPLCRPAGHLLTMWPARWIMYTRPTEDKMVSALTAAETTCDPVNMVSCGDCRTFRRP